MLYRILCALGWHLTEERKVEVNRNTQLVVMCPHCDYVGEWVTPGDVWA